jgi:hypothetical protein
MHDKMDHESAIVYLNHSFFGQTFQSSSKVLINVKKKIMMTSFIVLSTQL